MLPSAWLPGRLSSRRMGRRLCAAGLRIFTPRRSVRQRSSCRQPPAARCSTTWPRSYAPALASSGRDTSRCWGDPFGRSPSPLECAVGRELGRKRSPSLCKQRSCPNPSASAIPVGAGLPREHGRKPVPSTTIGPRPDCARMLRSQPANQPPDPEAPRSGQHLPKHFHTRSIRLHHHACRQFPNPTHFDPLPLRRRSHGTRVSRILSATASSPAYLQEQPKKGDVRTSSRSAQFLPRSR